MTQGSLLLRNPKVAAQIAQLRKEQDFRLDRSADEVIRRLWKIVEADVRKAFNGDGVALPPSEIPDDLAVALAGLKIGENIEYKLNDRLKALELLGKYHALFTEKIQTEVTQHAQVVIMLPNNGRDTELTKGNQDGNG